MSCSVLCGVRVGRKNAIGELIFDLHYLSLSVSDVNLALHNDFAIISARYYTQPSSISLPLRSFTIAKTNHDIGYRSSNSGLNSDSYHIRTRTLNSQSQSQPAINITFIRRPMILHRATPHLTTPYSTARHRTSPYHQPSNHQTPSPTSTIGIHPSPRIHDPDGVGPLWELFEERGL
jgi:hypothetical protein